MLRRYYGKISKLPIDEFVGHDGELVVDDITGKVYVMDGVTYGGTELVGATPRFGSLPPENPTPGALWYDPESGRTYIYYQSQWVDAAPNTTYILPEASTSRLGGIKVGNNLSIDEHGFLNAEDGNYILPTASHTILGGVKVDNTSVAIDGTGTISINASFMSSYATQSFVTGRGYITANALTGLATETFVTNRGYITANALTGLASESFVTGRGYITANSLTGLATETFVTNKGYITANALTGLATESYVTSRGYITSVPTASNSQLGVVKVDNSTIVINNGTISSVGANSVIPPSSTAPLSPTNGQLWYDTVSGKIFVYITDAWVDTNTSIPLAGPAPSHPNSIGTVGQIAYDSGYVYICIATNTWKRSALSTWT